jgi:glycosyltransferase involved in cell wall biosynthesis
MKKIVIASVLKPVDDVRMYEKFTQTLVENTDNQYEIHIIGALSTQSQAIKPPPSVYFHTIAHFHRLQFHRWLLGIYFLQKILQIRPNLFIITTPELLVAALLSKIRLGIPIIYDVQENYFRNILYQPTYSLVFRIPLALGVRFLEYLSRMWVDFYFLAEKNYEKEFSFSKNKSKIIENKYKADKQSFFKKTSKNIDYQSVLTFLYTGTISPTYGTLKAIHFIKKLKKYFPNSQLLIKGYCSNPQYRQLLEKSAEGCGFITLAISEIPIHHQEIIEAFTGADIALLPYLPNKSTENCIPAKLYEYIAHLLPMIMQKNPLWEEVCSPTHAALFIDFENFDAELLGELMVRFPFYKDSKTDFVWWESESQKLKQVIEQIIDKKKLA